MALNLVRDMLIATDCPLPGISVSAYSIHSPALPTTSLWWKRLLGGARVFLGQLPTMVSFLISARTVEIENCAILGHVLHRHHWLAGFVYYGSEGLDAIGRPGK